MLFGFVCGSGKILPQFASKICSSVSLRTFAKRTVCAPYEEPLCSKDRLARLPHCLANVQRLEENKTLKLTNSMWENPECCSEACPNYFPRYDELYYKSSDKIKRKYQQTWISFPKLEKRPKLTCVYDTLELPPIKRRTAKKTPKTACPIGGNNICKHIGESLCPRLKLMCCPRARVPPKCKRQRQPTRCEKDCAPYPSYSECLHDNPNFVKPFECRCMDQQMMCQVWAELRRRSAFIKVPV